MFEIDDKFYEETGLNAMPPQELAAFKNHIEEEAQVRIGERISDGLPLDLLDQFEKIIDGDVNFAKEWLAANAPDYRNDELFKASLQMSNGQETPETITQIAGIMWLQKNRPDFGKIIEDVTNEMKSEIRANASKLV